MAGMALNDLLIFFSLAGSNFTSFSNNPARNIAVRQATELSFITRIHCDCKVDPDRLCNRPTK